MSLLSASIATGQWLQEIDPANCLDGWAVNYDDSLAITKFSPSAKNPFDGYAHNPKKIFETIFFPDTSHLPDPTIPPTQVTDYYWTQAPIPSSLHQRCTEITEGSGKFLYFCPVEKLDGVWNNFQAAYNEGKLGYGIQCATSKPSPNARDDKTKVITIHLENSFDLDAVSQVAWEIDKVLGNWQGVLQYMTDEHTKQRLCGSPPFMLYSISSRSFIINPKSGGTDKKSLEAFRAVFKWKNENRFRLNP